MHKWLTEDDITVLEELLLGIPTDNAVLRLIADRREMRKLHRRVIRGAKLSSALWEDIQDMLEATGDD